MTLSRRSALKTGCRRFSGDLDLVETTAGSREEGQKPKATSTSRCASGATKTWRWTTWRGSRLASESNRLNC